MKRLLFLLLPLALAGCVTTGQGSVTGGECKVFEAPSYAIRGATQRDQDWIDPTIESGVGACGWKRPAPRPAEWDAPRKTQPHKAAPAKVKKRGGWIWKAIPTLAKKPAPAPVVEPEPVQVQEAPVAPAPSAAPAPPRSVIDELLHPSVQ